MALRAIRFAEKNLHPRLSDPGGGCRRLWRKAAQISYDSPDFLIRQIIRAHCSTGNALANSPKYLLIASAVNPAADCEIRPLSASVGVHTVTSRAVYSEAGFSLLNGRGIPCH